MKLLDDNPAVDDSLGFGRMLDILTSLVGSPSRLPLTIGLFGEWGSGKTSLMRLLQQRLEPNTPTVWFNAWKYDNKEAIWNALLQTIFYTMLERSGPQERSAFAEKVGRVARETARYAGKVAVRIVPGVPVRDEDIDGFIDGVTTSATDKQFAFINQFEAHFADLVRDYVGQRGHLVVFVDDLDRCMPENAITVLEALKLYLDRADCVFVVAAEREMIEHGIRLRYEGLTELSARDYLEKIVQLPITMPRVTPSAVLSLLDAHEAVLSYRTDASLGDLIVRGTDCNPRRVKRFMNLYSFLSEVAGPFGRDDRRLVAKLLLLQIRFPDLYDALVDDPALVEERLMPLFALEEDARRTELSRLPTRMRGVFADSELASFLTNTNAIPLTRFEIEPWLRLTERVTAATLEGRYPDDRHTNWDRGLANR